MVQGIVKALTEYRHQLLENRVRIFVRRGGPNYQEGLKVMREVGEKEKSFFTIVWYVYIVQAIIPQFLNY